MLTFRTAGEGTSSDEPPLVLQEKGGVPRNPTWNKTDEDIQEKGPTQLDWLNVLKACAMVESLSQNWYNWGTQNLH